MEENLTFHIGNLLQKPIGTSDQYSFDTPAKIEGITTKSSISGDVQVMKVENGLNASVTDVELDVEFECEKCLKKFTKTIKIDQSDRHFYLNKPKDFKDIADLFLIDKKHLKIDLSDMLRQEITLHFPANQVCSDGCKGICHLCGNNKNEKKCACEPEKVEEHKPLAALKDLIK